MIEGVIILCWTILLYAWLGYPLFLNLHDKRASAAGHVGEWDPQSLPTIAVLLSAHNEEQHIAERVDNLLALEYPAEKMTVRVGADGCTDDTVNIVQRQASQHAGIFCHAVSERRGKAAMLKDLVAQSAEDILVFTDANTQFQPDTLTKLLKHFDDPTIGGVCGRLIFVSPKDFHADTPTLPYSDTSAEGVYWRWETELKERESALDSCLGANGAVYAVRRTLFWEDLPDNTIIDDFVIGMKVREQGFRMVYEPGALAYEALPDQVLHEWGRRTRIGAGGYQALALCRECLLPRYGKFAWAFWSHKVLRWFSPHLILVLLIAGWISLSSSIRVNPIAVSAFPYLITPLAISGLIAAWGLAGLLRRFRACPRPLRLVDHFMAMQAALFAGCLRFCRGNLKGYWQRTPRG